MRTRADRTDLRTNNSSLTDLFTWYYRRLTGRDGAAPGSCWPAGFEAPSPRRSHPAGLRRMTVVQAPRQRVAGHLHQLHQHDEDDDGLDHDVAPEPLVAVADRQVAEAAAADGARHGGIAHQAHRGDGEAQDQGGEALGQEHFPDDLERRGTHALRRRDDAEVHLAEGAL